MRSAWQPSPFRESPWSTITSRIARSSPTDHDSSGPACPPPVTPEDRKGANCSAVRDSARSEARRRLRDPFAASPESARASISCFDQLATARSISRPVASAALTTVSCIAGKKVCGRGA